MFLTFSKTLTQLSEKTVQKFVVEAQCSSFGLVANPVGGILQELIPECLASKGRQCSIDFLPGSWELESSQLISFVFFSDNALPGHDLLADANNIQGRYPAWCQGAIAVFNSTLAVWCQSRYERHLDTDIPFG